MYSGFWYWIAIGVAFLISGTFFYCTYKNVICYYDSDIEQGRNAS